MSTYEATVTSKGQITLPSRLREALGLKTGDKIVFQTDDTGVVRVEARTDTFASLRGIVKTGEPVDAEKIAGWIAEARGARWQRWRDGES